MPSGTWPFCLSSLTFLLLTSTNNIFYKLPLAKVTYPEANRAYYLTMKGNAAKSTCDVWENKSRTVFHCYDRVSMCTSRRRRKSLDSQTGNFSMGYRSPVYCQYLCSYLDHLEFSMHFSWTEKHYPVHFERCIALMDWGLVACGLDSAPMKQFDFGHWGCYPILISVRKCLSKTSLLLKRGKCLKTFVTRYGRKSKGGGCGHIQRIVVNPELPLCHITTHLAFHPSMH